VIESAYRRLARKYHPDLNRDPGAHARMVELNQAYAILGDPMRRTEFDRQQSARDRSSDGGGSYSTGGSAGHTDFGNQASRNYTEEFLRSMFALAAEMMGAGKTRPTIIRALLDHGLTQELADALYERLRAMREQAIRQAARESARNNMAVGALLFFGGLIVTLVMPVIAWGAMLYGAYRFAIGVKEHFTRGDGGADAEAATAPSSGLNQRSSGLQAIWQFVVRAGKVGAAVLGLGWVGFWLWLGLVDRYLPSLVLAGFSLLLLVLLFNAAGLRRRIPLLRSSHKLKAALGWVGVLVIAAGSTAAAVGVGDRGYLGPLSEAEIAAQVVPSVVQVMTEQSMGSGVIVREGVLTNAHVVGQEDHATVIMDNGRRLSAVVTALDSSRDLALLELSERLPALTLQDAREERQGNGVLVLGYPRSEVLSGPATLTRGLVSAVRDEQGVTLLQTDAAMNPGNSGGAVVNMRGRLLGIAVASLRESQGLNFAIATESVRAFLQERPRPPLKSQTAGSVPAVSAEQAATARDPAEASMATGPVSGCFESTAAVVYVANTNGIGLFLRRSPDLADRLAAYPEGITLRVADQSFEANGLCWLPVTAPDGHNGLALVDYVSTTAPTPTPTPRPQPTATPPRATIQLPPVQVPLEPVRPPTVVPLATSRLTSTERLRLESSYVLAATNAGYPRQQAESEARQFPEAELLRRIDRYRIESSYILAATNAGYGRQDAMAEARALSEAQLQARIERFRQESSFILAATNAAYPRSWAIEQARSASDAEMQTRIERFRLESSYILAATNAGRPRSEAIAAAREASDSELRDALRR
jgi:S1-C subfamily serine protease